MDDRFNGKDRDLLHDIDNRVVGIQAEISSINKTLERFDGGLVTKEAFKPVAAIAYGLSGTVLSMVLGALLWLLVKN
jgi:hypothetical protein